MGLNRIGASPPPANPHPPAGARARPALGRALRLALMAGLVIALAGAAWEAAVLARGQAERDRLSGGPLPPEAADDTPRLRFARAQALAAAGDIDTAIHRYGALHDDPQVGKAARYNGANLLLRQGMALHAGAQPGQALALIELAKQGYRELLRQDPDDWPARYNLERAQRLVPDPDGDADEAAAQRQRAERAPTTMRGYSPGLP